MWVMNCLPCPTPHPPTCFSALLSPRVPGGQVPSLIVWSFSGDPRNFWVTRGTWPGCPGPLQEAGAGGMQSRVAGKAGLRLGAWPGGLYPTACCALLPVREDTASLTALCRPSKNLDSVWHAPGCQPRLAWQEPWRRQISHPAPPGRKPRAAEPQGRFCGLAGRWPQQADTDVGAATEAQPGGSPEPLVQPQGGRRSPQPLPSLSLSPPHADPGGPCPTPRGPPRRPHWQRGHFPGGS